MTRTDAEKPLAAPLAGNVARLAAELAMIAIVVVTIVDDTVDDLESLSLWCLIACVYAGWTIIAVAISSKRAGNGRRIRVALRSAWLFRMVVLVGTVASSFFGLYAATGVLLAHTETDPSRQAGVRIIGVAAMLLSWGFLHWGFARIYLNAYYRNPLRPPLRFPGTSTPVLADFVYFAYTLGTSFAVSDVETLTTPIRWTIVSHSVLSFFFNGLIVVLALNTIMSAGR